MSGPLTHLGLSAQDVAYGFVAGLVPGRGDPLARVSATPAAALAVALRPALQRAPCVVGFSGGRDSSLLLAVAAAEARRAGLPLPVPVTLEFEGEATRESEWQELVIDHLGLQDWVRLPQGFDLDMVGPVAGEGLERHGVLYPGNAHMVLPLARVAAGGSVVSGFAGDDVLGGWPWESTMALLARRRAPSIHDLRPASWCVAPARRRSLRYAHDRSWLRLSWLRAPHQERAARLIAADVAGSPRTWKHRMRWLSRRRMWPVSEHAMALHAGEFSATVHVPLLDPGFLAALAAAGGRLGLGDRTAVMRAVAGELLPASLIERDTKAEFSEPYFGPHTRRFARWWDGSTGIDPAVVDAEALRETWLSDHPHGLSAVLLQSAWLATRRAEAARGAPPLTEALDGNR